MNSRKKNKISQPVLFLFDCCSFLFEKMKFVIGCSRLRDVGCSQREREEVKKRRTHQKIVFLFFSNSFHLVVLTVKTFSSALSFSTLKKNFKSIPRTKKKFFHRRWRAAATIRSLIKKFRFENRKTLNNSSIWFEENVFFSSRWKFDVFLLQVQTTMSQIQDKFTNMSDSIMTRSLKTKFQWIFLSRKYFLSFKSTTSENGSTVSNETSPVLFLKRTLNFLEKKNSFV